MDAKQTVSDFLRGKINIVIFRKYYNENPEIDAFLQGIADEIRTKGGTDRKSVV